MVLAGNCGYYGRLGVSLGLGNSWGNPFAIIREIREKNDHPPQSPCRHELQAGQRLDSDVFLDADHHGVSERGRRNTGIFA